MNIKRSVQIFTSDGDEILRENIIGLKIKEGVVQFTQHYEVEGKNYWDINYIPLATVIQVIETQEEIES